MNPEAHFRTKLAEYARPTVEFDPVPLTADPFAHKLCTVGVALPTETWPEWNGKPMVGMLQINLTRLDFVPPILADFALVTVFYSNFFDGGPLPTNQCDNGEGWLVRNYRTLEGLVPIVNAPNNPKHAVPHDLAALPVLQEFPDIEYFPDDAPELYQAYEAVDTGDFETYTKLGIPPASERNKIGGFPSCIQYELVDQFPPEYEFAIQISTDAKAKLFIIDGGSIYFARNSNAPPHKEWVSDIQFF